MDLIRRTTALSRPRLVLGLALVVAALLAIAVTIDPASTRPPGHSDGGATAPSASTVGNGGGSSGGSSGGTATDERAIGSASGVAIAPAKASSDVAIGGAGAASAAAQPELGANDAIAPTTGSLDAPGLDVKVLRTADVTIRVKRGTFDDRWARAMRLASRTGGYVSSSSLSKYGADAPRSGSITLRVPAERFDDTLADLRGLGVVVSLDQSSQDVTQEFVDTKSRQRHDRAVEGRLLQLLGKAKNVSETLTIQDRLDTVQQQIEVETGRLQYLDKMTSFSTLDLQLEERGAHQPRPVVRHHARWGVSTAMRTAAHRAVANVNRSIVWFGGALPMLLVLLLAAVGGRAYLARRRRRDEEARVARDVPPSAGA